MNLPQLQEALSRGHYETARRIGYTLLNDPQKAPTADLVFALHDALVKLADFNDARRLLEENASTLQAVPVATGLRLAGDYQTLADDGQYRTSQEASQGYTVDEYIEKYNALAREELAKVKALARTDDDRAAIAAFEAPKARAPYTRFERLEAPDFPAESSGVVTGRIVFANGSPVANAVVTLGLEVLIDSPDPAEFLSHEMHFVPRVGPLRKLTCRSGTDGAFTFSNVPSGQHEFIAVTLDPMDHALPTRFIHRDIPVGESAQIDVGTLTVQEWESAPSRPFPSPHADSFTDEGIEWSKCAEWKLRNPFHYDFPRQLLELDLPDSTSAYRIQITPDNDEPFQVIDGNKAAILTELPAKAERAIAIYQSRSTCKHLAPTPAHALTRNNSGDQLWEIDSGPAQFLLAATTDAATIAPLHAVRGPDNQWRGRGRFALPEGIHIADCTIEFLEDGPLLTRVQYRYRLSNDQHYAITFTALAGTNILLATEESDAVEGAAFEFSLKEFSGGRGYLHWNPETGSRHWSQLDANDAVLAELQESIAWWIPPKGFAYAMSADGLEQQDYIGVFSRRRGEWIDRKFAEITQGPMDEDGRENRELDWPYPEMIGSDISMITAHTSAEGDAFFRFGLFDGVRHWGIMASSFANNDGPWKELGRTQHAYSSPRLQEFKDWSFDQPDTYARPHLVAEREDLITLRRKAKSGPFAGLFDKIRREPVKGPREGLRFAVDCDPLVAWEMRICLCAIADIRSKMTLLGRDWSDSYSPVGGRNITMWAEEYDFIAPSGVFSEDEERKVRDFFILMGHMYLQEDHMNWRYNGRNANFEADRADIIGAVGLAFDGHPDARIFTQHVIDCTRNSLVAYCDPDSGKWYENPCCYYLHAASCRLNIVFHLAKKGRLDLESIPRLKQFLRWGIILLTPPHTIRYDIMRDGDEAAFLGDEKVRKVPPIGDHAGIGRWLSENYAYLGKLFEKSDPVLAREMIDAYFCANADGLRLRGLGSWENNTPESDAISPHTSAVAGNLPALFCNFNEEDIPPNPVIAPRSRRLEGFGAVFRNAVNTPDESYLLIKQGPGGYRYHRSEGSFLLFANGRPLIFDGGEAGETWRHSTLSFHDVHMPLSAGRVERYFDQGGFQFCQGVHPVILQPGQPVFLSDSCRHELVEEAWRRYRIEPPAVTRSFAWVDNEYLIIHDDLSASQPALSHWHVQVVGDKPTECAPGDFRFPGRFGIDLQIILPGQDFASQSITTQPILHYRGEPEDWFAMEHLQLSKQHAQDYLAVLKPVASGLEADLSAIALKDGERIIGTEVNHAAGRDLFWFCRSGTQFESNDDIRFEGQFGSCLQREKSTRLILVGVGSIETPDISLFSDGPQASLCIAEQTTLNLQGNGIVQVVIDGQKLTFEATNEPLSITLEPASYSTRTR